MFNVDYETGEITMHRGDTGSYVLHAARSDGSSWTEDDRLLYTVKNSKGEIVLQRLYRLDDQWDLGDGVVLVVFRGTPVRDRPDLGRHAAHHPVRERADSGRQDGRGRHCAGAGNRADVHDTE